MPGRKVEKVGQYSQEQGGNWSFDEDLAGKIHLAAVSSGLELSVEIDFTQTILCAITNLNNTVAASATETILAAMATTAPRVHGISISNSSTTVRNIEIRSGSTPFFRGSAAANGGQLPYTWDLAAFDLDSNKTVSIWIDNAGTAIVTMYYEEQAVEVPAVRRGWPAFVRFGPRR